MIYLVTGTPKPAGAQPDTCPWTTLHNVVLTTALPLPVSPMVLHPAEALTVGTLHRPAHDPRGMLARGPPTLV